MLKILSPNDSAYQETVDGLAHRGAEASADITKAAMDIVHQVRREGDAAVRALTSKFEGRDLSAFEIPAADWQGAIDKVAPAVRQAIELAAARIRAFHEKETYGEVRLDDGAGVNIRLVPSGLERVCVYVPGGRAKYPSTVLMTAIPAACAGSKKSA